MEADIAPYRDGGHGRDACATNLEGAKYTLAVPTSLCRRRA